MLQAPWSKLQTAGSESKSECWPSRTNLCPRKKGNLLLFGAGSDSEAQDIIPNCSLIYLRATLMGQLPTGQRGVAGGPAAASAACQGYRKLQTIRYQISKYIENIFASLVKYYIIILLSQNSKLHGFWTTIHKIITTKYKQYIAMSILI